MKTKHIHKFKTGKSNKVKICSCGKFEHINFRPEDVIVGIEAKHTPGPWTCEENEIVGQRYICTLADWSIVAAGSKYDQQNKALLAEKSANARLIAAAPELLSAVKGAFMAIQAKCDVVIGAEKEWHFVRDALKAAIAKAEGRT